MADMEKAKVVYEGLCNALTHDEWKFERHDEDLVVATGVRGDDLPMKFVIKVDAEREIVRLMSPLDFEVKEDKRMEMAVAVTMANNQMINGAFDFDLGDGKIVFRMTIPYCGSVLGREVFEYLVHGSAVTIDNYNEKLLALATGMMELEKYMEAINKD